MAGAEASFSIGPPQMGQAASGGSENYWIRSNMPS
jgi:hypothetical protein